MNTLTLTIGTPWKSPNGLTYHGPNVEVCEELDHITLDQDNGNINSDTVSIPFEHLPALISFLQSIVDGEANQTVTNP